MRNRKRKNQRRKKRNSKNLRNNLKGLTFEPLEVRRLLAGDSSLVEFSPEAGLYQIYSNYGRLGQVDLETKTFEIAQYNAGTGVNAVGFRTADNYAYGFVNQSDSIARVGANGEVESLGQVDGLPIDKGNYFVGDFANDDLLYLRNSGQKSILYGVNVDTMTVDNVINTSVDLNNIYDIAFNNTDQKFYASQRGAENLLISVDLEGEVEVIGKNGVGKLTFGAMYADADGNVFGGANQTGDVYRFNTSTGAAVIVGKGPTSGSNDGFSNAARVLELAPNANDDTFTMEAVDVVTGNVLTGEGADLDGNDDDFVVTAINDDTSAIGTTIELDSGATLAVADDGKFAYKPSISHVCLTVGEQSTDTFQYTITDTSGRSSTAKVTITIDGVMAVSEFGTNRAYGMDSFGGNPFGLLTDVGDVNGDGFTDGAIAYTGARDGRGATFLVYGTADGLEPNFNVNELRALSGNDGSLGTIFFGVAPDDLSGFSLASGGDVNGDGIDDLLISAKDADANGNFNAGQVFVVYGNEQGFGAEFNLSSLMSNFGGDGSEGFVVNGISENDLAGQVVAGIGDFNADGIDDIAIGARHADADASRVNSGQAYVVFGNDQGFDAEFNLSDLQSANGGDGSEGFIINGVRKHDLFAGFIKGGEDLNGDDIADTLMTAKFADAKGLVDSGQSYILYGSKDGFDAEMELSGLLTENGGDGSNGIAINGSQQSQFNGSFVDLIEDMDGDGVAELLIGKGGSDANCAGVIYSGTNVFGDEIDISKFDSTAVFLDNFDRITDYDSRAWDSLPFSATLYSANGTQVSIWGDPHVVIVTNGNTERFDIGYGEGRIEVGDGAVVTWDTFEPDDVRFPLGPPIKYFSVDSAKDDLDVTVVTANATNDIGNLTALTEGQLLEFAAQLRLLEGDASLPLGS